MDNKEKIYISEPDENGIRYYDSTSENRNKEPSGRKKMYRNIAVIAAVFLIVCIIGLFNKTNDPYIATIYVEGAIQNGNADYLGRAVGYQHQWTLDMIDELAEDEDNKGIIMFVNSPGGGVYESDELYLRIKEYKEKTGNPVYSVMGNMAASGGYYISAPCDMIYANRNTWTGSIGVTVGTMVDVSDFLEKNGIKTKTLTSGKHKAMGSAFQEMTPEEEAIWQSLIDDAYEQFTEIVAEGRNLSIDNVKAIADGRIMNAAQALDAGLVDKIGGIDEAYSDMLEEIKGKKSDIRRSDITYSEKGGVLSGLLNGISGAVSGISGYKGEVLELVDQIETRPVSYMCEILAK